MRGEGGLARPLSFVLASRWHRGVTKGVQGRSQTPETSQQIGPEGQMLVCWGVSSLNSAPLQGFGGMGRTGEANEKTM